VKLELEVNGYTVSLDGEVNEIIEELKALDAAATALIDAAVEVQQKFVAKGVFTKSQKPKASPSTPPPGSGDVPTCNHGPRKDLGHKNYKHRWYCAAPYNATDKCDPID